jgi:hypothetical protein
MSENRDITAERDTCQQGWSQSLDKLAAYRAT